MERYNSLSKFFIKGEIKMKEELKNKIEKTKANAKVFWDKHGEAIFAGVICSVYCGLCSHYSYRKGVGHGIYRTSVLTHNWMLGEFPEEYKGMLNKMEADPQLIENMRKYSSEIPAQWN